MSVASIKACAANKPQWLPAVSNLAVEPSLGALTCRLHVPGDLPICAGHFPAMPIVPGVVQLGWIVALARDQGLVSGEFAGIVSAKFRQLVRPGADLRARLERGRSPGLLQFEISAGSVVVSCGRLRFGDD